jgi:large subunit ribosomal protein L18
MKDRHQIKKLKRQIRHQRARSKVKGTALRPRLSVFKANRHIYAQLINDEAGKTLAAACSLEVKTKGKKTAISKEVGKILAKKALVKDVRQVVFDRSGFKYHGRIKALAEGAREGGLKF